MDWGEEIRTRVAAVRALLGEGAEPPELGAFWNRPFEDAALGVACPEDGADEAGCDAWAAEMLKAPDDMAPRVAAFLFYEEAAAFADEDVDTGAETEEAEVRAVDAVKNLGLLVKLLSVKDCRKSWSWLRFEISAALTIGDWDRVRLLFAKTEADEAMDLATLRLLRGQSAFLHTFGRKGHSVRPWYLTAPGEHSGFLAMDLASDAYSLAIGEGPPVGQQAGSLLPNSDVLRTACTDLSSAACEEVLATAAYGAMLGACAHATGDYARAADAFSSVLAVGGDLKGISGRALISALAACPERPGEDLMQRLARAIARVESKDFKRGLLLWLADSQMRAGRSAEAERTFESCIQQYPECQVAYKALSSHLSEQTRYGEAAEVLRRESETFPQVEREPAYKVALAFREIVAGMSPQRLSAEFLRENHHIAEMIASMCADEWPNFRNLPPPLADEWICGLLCAHYLSRQFPGREAAFLNEAVRDFGHVLEAELQRLIFRPAAEQGVLQCGSSPGKWHLRNMLLQIDRALKERRSGFGFWIAQNFPGLVSRVRELDEIAGLNNEAKHGIQQKPDGVPRRCREILDAIYPMALKRLAARDR